MTPDIIVIGASAGGVEASQKIVAALPGDLDASVFLVLHTPANSPRLMARILSGVGDLKASYPEDGQIIERRQIYIAPPDHHLLLEPGTIKVVRGPKENRHRPAIDPLFRSAAAHYRQRVIGAILTGYLNDGTSGLLAVKQCGGIAIVQDPEEASVPSMPASALKHVPVDYCLQLREIAPLLAKLVNTPRTGKEIPMAAPESIATEAQIASMQCQDPAVTDRLGKRSTLTCPECGGTLWQMHDEKMLRYRCHAGHALTAEHLSAEQNEAVEKALWIAFKTLEESEALASQMAACAERDGDEFIQKLFEKRAEEATTHAAALRALLKQAQNSSFLQS